MIMSVRRTLSETEMEKGGMPMLVMSEHPSPQYGVETWKYMRTIPVAAPVTSALSITNGLWGS